MENGSNIIRLALTIAIMFIFTQAFAAEEVAEPPLVAPAPQIEGRYSDSNLARLTEVLAKTRLKEAELHLLTIESKILELEQRLESMRCAREKVPTASLVGAGESPKARLRFPDGSVYEAGVGAKLQNGAKVLDIQPQSVIIEVGDRRLILPVMEDRGK